MRESNRSDLLLAHAAGLRRLARALLRDPVEAEDAVQETWRIALSDAPDRLDRPEAWLRRVLRGVVHKRLRSGARRADRERRVARPAYTPDAGSVAARSETLARVVDAVRALEPPLREVVLLRHFEDLPPREIAKRTGATVPTVNGRLRRAHAKLRESLDADGGPPWMPALAICFGLRPRDPFTVGVATAATVLSSSVLWRLGGAVAATSVIVLWPALDAAVLSPPIRPDTIVAATAGELPPARLDPPRSEGRVPVFAADVAPPPFVDAPRLDYRLRVLAVGPDDLPRAGVPLFLAPPGERANLVGRTNEDGFVEARWNARVPVMEIDWSLGREALGTRPRRVRVAAGRSYEWAASLLDVEFDAVNRDAVRPRFDDGAACLDGVPEALEDEDGGLRFVSEAAALVDRRRYREKPVKRRTADHDEDPRPDWTLSGQVLFPDGTPAAGVPVGHGERLGDLHVVLTDDDGWYETGGRGEGPRVLFAGGGDDPREVDTVTVRNGSHHAWNPILEADIALVGDVRGYDGRPLSGWLVTVVNSGDTPAFADRAFTDEAGAFRIPDCPEGKLFVRARPADAGSSAAWVEQDGVLAAHGYLPLIALSDERASVRIPGPRANGVEELRLVSDDDGSIAWFTHDRGGWSIAGLPPGRYHVEALSGSRGFLAQPRFHVFPGESVELSPWLVRSSSRVTFGGLPADRGTELVLERLDGPVRVDLPLSLPFGPPPSVELPPGDYRVHVAGRPWATRELHMTESLWTTLDVPFEPPGAADDVNAGPGSPSASDPRTSPSARDSSRRR